MKRLSIALLALVASLPCAAQSEQGPLQLTFEKPDDYRDIRPANQTRDSFRKQVFNQLDKYLRERLMSQLPEGYQLAMTITDIANS